MVDQAELNECLVCGGHDIRSGLFWPAVPAHTVVLHHSPGAARDQPLGDMRLVNCHDCGFVFNKDYDQSLHHYRDDYEATQSFSGTFNAFNEEIAVEIALECAGHGGPVIEVGCGQGEFLALLRQHGIDQLTGFDPAFDGARSAVAGMRDVTVEPSIFSSDMVAASPAGIVCKMTLEHIARPVGFLADIASLARHSESCPVFIQVPNAEEVFSKGAFWDVYYEHCCYFTSRTLGLALQRAGLTLLDVRKGFSGQYLIARATASGGNCRQPDSGIGLQSDLDLFAAFTRGVHHATGKWRNWASRVVSSNGKVALWGGGSKAVAFLSATGMAQSVSAAIDINPRKAGTYLAASAVPVLSPDMAARAHITDIVLLNPVYEAEVVEMMSQVGFKANLHILGETMSSAQC